MLFVILARFAVSVPFDMAHDCSGARAQLFGRDTSYGVAQKIGRRRRVGNQVG